MDKEKEEKREAETHNETYVVHPLEYCKPRSISELTNDKEDDKRVSFS